MFGSVPVAKVYIRDAFAALVMREYRSSTCYNDPEQTGIINPTRSLRDSVAPTPRSKVDQLLATKLFIPRTQPELVARPRLIKQLKDNLYRKLSLISAPAGFGKTTLASEWVAQCQQPVAWVSLDQEDSDPGCFLSYLISALQSVVPDIGKNILGMLETTPTPPIQPLLTMLINEITAIPEDFILILDDYHLVEAPAVDQALAFLIDNAPPQMHLVITTREDPNLPISRLRARGQLNEIRVADLRFTYQEAADFLNRMMGLNLTPENIAALEARTEGWIAGLQLAALSLRGQTDTDQFIENFTGSHHFVLDYLVEEVLLQQSEPVQNFLLHISILGRLCGPLCDAVLLDPAVPGQATLESIQQANLFLTPLDNERQWYRYHQLFADLLQQRLNQSATIDVAELHRRASQWYEANGLELEAFHHATVANDIARALRLIEGEGLPLYFRGEAIPVRQWLESLPQAEFKTRPALWVIYAAVLTMTGRLQDNIEDILESAEKALQDAVYDDKTKDLFGQIATIRAMLAVPKNLVETIITQSRLALELLHPDNAPMRTTTTWTMGYAYQVQGNRTAARKAYAETIAQSQKSGNIMTEIAATTCIGQIQETENQAHQAAKSFQRILQLVGDPPWPAACEACVGLARIHYQWNDLEAAERYGQQGLALAQPLENVDTPAACGILLARVKLAQGNAAGALTTLDEAEQFVQQHHFEHWLGEITAVRIQTHLHQGNLTAAVPLAESLDNPLSLARIHLAQDEPAAAFAQLELVRQQAKTNDWADKRLQMLVLQALAHQAAGESEPAVQTLGEALALAQPGGLIRIFVDEGAPMADLLSRAAAQRNRMAAIQKVLAAFEADAPPPDQSLIEPLTERELEVLRLVAEGFSNREIGEQLFLALNTVKGYNQKIFNKLQVHRRTEAVARARELGLL
jgi:LuxR family transcriptional regulator, maltose regulon positive regulatory protein